MRAGVEEKTKLRAFFVKCEADLLIIAIDHC
jgi:hypothetical protein